jgi:hypothetical protein
VKHHPTTRWAPQEWDRRSKGLFRKPPQPRKFHPTESGPLAPAQAPGRRLEKSRVMRAKAVEIAILSAQQDPIPIGTERPARKLSIRERRHWIREAGVSPSIRYFNGLLGNKQMVDAVAWDRKRRMR